MADKNGEAGMERMPEWLQARQAVLSLYDACGLPAPRIHVAQTAGQFRETVRVALAVGPSSRRTIVNVVIAVLSVVAVLALLYWTGKADMAVFLFFSGGVSLLAALVFLDELLVIPDLVSFHGKTPFKGALAASPHLADCLASSGAVGQSAFSVPDRRIICLREPPAPDAGPAVLDSRMASIVANIRSYVADALLSGTDVVLLPRQDEPGWDGPSFRKPLSRRGSRKMLAAARRVPKPETMMALEDVGRSMAALADARDGLREVDWRERLSGAGLLQLVSRAAGDSLWEFRAKGHRIAWLRQESHDGSQPTWTSVPEHMADATEALHWIRQEPWPGTADIPSDPEALLTELYRACGLPPPRIVAVGSRPAFAELMARVRDLRSSRASIVTSLVIAALLAAAMAMLTRLPEPDTAAVMGICCALLFAAYLRFIYQDLRRRWLNPFREPIQGNALLAGYLQSAGCVTGQLAANGIVSWGVPHVWGDFQGTPDQRSRVGDLYAAARRMFPVSALGDGAVIAMVEPVGFTASVTDGTDTFRRLVEDACRLRPGEAQAELEFLGIAAVMAVLGKQPRVRDARGALWQLEVSGGRVTWLQADDPATGHDVWMVVPNHLSTPGEAVAWTYGLAEVDYAPTLEG